MEFRNEVFNVSSEVSMMFVLNGLNSKSPFAIFFFVFCMEVCKLNRPRNFVKEPASFFFTTALGFNERL
jgi:hypothetical protein